MPLIDFFRVYLEKRMLEKESSQDRLNPIKTLQSAYLVCTSARLLATAGVIEKCMGLLFNEKDIQDPAYANFHPTPESHSTIIIYR